MICSITYFYLFYVGIRVPVKAVIALAQAKKIKHPVQFGAGWLAAMFLLRIRGAPDEIFCPCV